MADHDALRSLAAAMRGCGVVSVTLSDAGEVTSMVLGPDESAQLETLTTTARASDATDAPRQEVRPSDPLWKSSGSRLEKAPHPRSMASDAPPDEEVEDE